MNTTDTYYTNSDAGEYLWTVDAEHGTIISASDEYSVTVTWHTTGESYLRVHSTVGGDTQITVKVDPLPVITGENSVCENSTGNDYSVLNVTGHEYSWMVTGGTITDVASPNQITVTWNAAGEGIVEVSESIPAMESSSYTTLPVTINPIPAAAGTITGEPNVCQWTSGVAFSVPTIAGATSYNWAYSGTGVKINGTTNNVTLDFSDSATEGDLTVAGVNSFCSGTGSEVYHITVNPIPKIKLGSNPAECPGVPPILPFTIVAGEPSVFSLDYDEAAEAQGLLDVSDAAIRDFNIHFIFLDDTPPGTYYASLTVKNDITGCVSQSYPVGFTIFVPTITLGADPEVCSGETTASLTYSKTTGEPDQYSIDYDVLAEAQGFVDIINAMLPAGQIPVIVPPGAEPDTYHANITVSNSAKVCASSGYDFSVKIYDLNPGTLSGTQSICYNTVPQPFTQTQASGGTGSFTYQWQSSTDNNSWDNIAGATAADYNPGALTVSSYFRRMVISSSCGTPTYSNIVNVNINPLPVPAISGNAAPCINSATVYTTEANMTGYTWTISSGGTRTAGGTATDNNITVAWNTAGTHYITVNYVNENGCTASSPVTMNISVGTPTLDLPDTEYICSNQDYLADAGIEAATYSWSSAMGFSASTRRATLTVPGKYYLTVTDEKGCTAKDSLILIREEGISDATFIMPREAGVGDTIVLIDLSWPAPDKIQWVYPSSFVCIFQNEWMTYLVPGEPGTFNIGIYSFVKNCSEFSEKQLTINKDRVIEKRSDQLPPVIDRVRVYPNPSEGDFSLEIFLNREADIRVEIFSLYGEKVIDRETSGEVFSRMNFNMDNKSGIFLVRIKAGDDLRIVRLIMH